MLDEGPASARDAARCSSWHAEIRIRIRIRFRIRIRSSGRQARVGFGIFCSIQHRQAHIFVNSQQASLSGTCWRWRGGTWFGFRRGKPRSTVLVQ